MSESGPLQPVEVTGPTLEEAIEDGLARLGLERNDVIIEIIEEGSKGVLGLGARNAVVRLTPLRSPQTFRQPSEEHVHPARATPLSAADLEKEVEAARATLEELLRHMHINATILVQRAETGSLDEETPWIFDIQGNDLGVLIGRRGETLEALQYIARLIVSHETQQRAAFVIDVESYKSRRETTLRKLAMRMAAEAKQRGQRITLEPMPPNERRIIHLALRDDRSVTTESIGEGDHRKVTIVPVRDSGH